MLANKQFNSKRETNGELLMRLTRRVQKKQGGKTDWPGKLAPTCLNLHHSRSMGSSCGTEKKRLVASSRTQVIKPIPLVKEGSQTLCLRPASISKIKIFTDPYQTFSGPHRTVTNRMGTEVFTSKPASFSNTKINFGNSEISKSFKNTEEQKKRQNVKEQKGKKLQKEKSQGKKLKDYVIQYDTFNYIDKVLQNPEKWAKFVYKKAKPQSKFMNEQKESLQERIY